MMTANPESGARSRGRAPVDVASGPFGQSRPIAGRRCVDRLLQALFHPPPLDRVVTVPVAAFALLCLAGFVGAVLLSRPDAVAVAARLGNPAVVQRHASTFSWLFGAGLFFVGVRLLQINPLTLGAPFWLLLCFGAIVGYAVQTMRHERTAVAA